MRSTPRPPAGKVPEKPGPPRRTPLLRLTWPARSGAAYFLVEVYRHGRLVHATSVHTRTFVVPSWLPAGRYEWRVLAGVASPASRKTSGVVDHGWFIVS